MAKRRLSDGRIAKLPNFTRQMIDEYFANDKASKTGELLGRIAAIQTGFFISTDFTGEE